MKDKSTNYMGLYAAIYVILGTIFFILVCLKLLGIITFSWLWVLVPIWGPSFLAAFALGISFLIITIKEKIEKHKYITKELYDE